jgi:hypothetical protein
MRYLLGVMITSVLCRMVDLAAVLPGNTRIVLATSYSNKTKDKYYTNIINCTILKWTGIRHYIPARTAPVT